MNSRIQFESSNVQYTGTTYTTFNNNEIEQLKLENREFKGQGGISQENRHVGFVPAFLDSISGTVYRSVYTDGRPAPIHLLDGLPDNLVRKSEISGKPISMRKNLVSGFLRSGLFYTRKEAADALLKENQDFNY